MGFLSLNFLLFILAIIFLLHQTLIIMINLSFFIGSCLLIGIQFSLKKGKLQRSIFYFLGLFATNIFKLTIIEFPLEIYGLFVMFKSKSLIQKMEIEVSAKVPYI
ncbi:unnamed protein product [Paramecium pentaurelia]|uniref:Uncharacterized protein n=1 Tax=Paramecium pentaurelia TaxID=43138 RepID=A0A8S1TSY8_9CILI|nr:unnamed protein product [Paramecium pentaurelia]